MPNDLSDAMSPSAPPEVPLTQDGVAESSIARLLEVMRRLRDPGHGCEWDLAQDFKTIAPYTIEEAYEVFDAIDRQDMTDLKDELGDLLFQVVFHAQMAAEAGHFDFEDVAARIVDKMEARHPHIFGDQHGQMTEGRWEALKAEERAHKGAKSALEGVALALPAAMRAQKLQKRAARVGFDWPDKEGPKSKVLEEIEELERASSEAELAEEAGDFLFAAINLVRAYGVDAEQALRDANRKFEKRFRMMEAQAGGNFAELDLDAQEALWQQVKAQEKQD